MKTENHVTHRESYNATVSIPIGPAYLDGQLIIPAEATGVVLFAHGSGSSRHSPRNQFVARAIRESGVVGTLLFDLLTAGEEREDAMTGVHRFDIRLLASRLLVATHWLKQQAGARELKVGYFGSSTGGGAALVAAAEAGKLVGAVVSRGGRPDLAGPALPFVQAPTLLIVGGDDEPVIGMNRTALAKLKCEKELKIVPGATHLFEEPGTLEQVAALATDWFERNLGP